MDTTPPPLQRLAEVIMGEPLAPWIASRREPEFRRSWRVIANELAAATGGEVVVSGEAVRTWYERMLSTPTEPEPAK